MEKICHLMDIYLGGERDSEKIFLPKRYDLFFDRATIFLILITLAITLLVVL